MKRLLRTLWSAWGAECPAGAPVPSVERCTAADCDSVRLVALGVGDRAWVTCLEEPGGAAARKLVALGVLPGVAVVLLQRSPVYVFRLGHTDLALDRELAAHVRVRREEG